MSRLLWCTALIGLVMPTVAVQADGPGCTPRMPCLQKKVCCLKEKLCNLRPRCVYSPIFRPTCRTTCCQQQSCCKTTCCKKEKEPEIERIVVRMEQPTARLQPLQMRTMMVPQQRIVMVPQVQTFMTPQTVVGGQFVGATGFNATGFNSVGAAGLNGGIQTQQQNDAAMRAMASMLQQRLAQRSNTTGARSQTQARTLQQIDDDLRKLSNRVDALEKAIRK
jgi:hypothetical protein